jgi:hypothetical protein
LLPGQASTAPTPHLATWVPSVEAAVLSFSVPSEHAEDGWWGGSSACQEVGGIVVEKLEWTPARKRDRSHGLREGWGSKRKLQDRATKP